MAYVVKHGHSRLLTDIMVLFVLSGLGSLFVVFEFLNLIVWPFRFTRRLMGMGPPILDANVASDRATGRKTTSHRKIVIFDGVCVLCNRFGRFVVSHIPDPNVVSFLPFQDPMSNPHISIKNLTKEFEFDEKEVLDRIAVVSGDKIYWGADAIVEILQWCYWPFPLIRFLKIVPYPIRDALYLTVAKNRYRWFGTQPLDKNFAKYLCPYIYFKTPSKSKKAKKNK